MLSSIVTRSIIEIVSEDVASIAAGCRERSVARLAMNAFVAEKASIASRVAHVARKVALLSVAGTPIGRRVCSGNCSSVAH